MKFGDQIYHLVDGQDVTGGDGRSFENINPWTQRPNGEISYGDADVVQMALTSARASFRDGRWSGLKAEERGRVLYRLADLIEENVDLLAEADMKDMGRPFALARLIDVPRAAANFRFFSDHARLATAETYPMGFTHHSFLTYEPAGVVAAITPWNHPLMLGTWKIAAPLAWGNSVVHKPAESSPTSARIIGKLALAAGMPPGVLNVVHGPGATTGAELISSPDVDRITFTGSTATGRAIASAAAANLTPVSLELGGKGAAIVFEDADLGEAVAALGRAVFNNSGQVCLSTSRIYVQRAVFTEFVERLVGLAEGLIVGDPSDSTTDLGPLASVEHFEKVMSYLELAPDEGGTVHTGGRSAGWAIRPTVITGVPSSGRICQEEIFGPLAMVLPFDSEAEALDASNSTDYGLSAVVFTKNLARAHRVSRSLRAGTVWVNCYQVRDLRAPLGGPGDSGIGREGGDFSREFFTEPKVTTMSTE